MLCTAGGLLVWWIVDEIISGKRTGKTLEEWLDAKRIGRLMSQEQWRRWMQRTERVRDFAAESFAIFMAKFVEQLSGLSQ